MSSSRRDDDKPEPSNPATSHRATTVATQPQPPRSILKPTYPPGSREPLFAPVAGPSSQPDSQETLVGRSQQPRVLTTGRPVRSLDADDGYVTEPEGDTESEQGDADDDDDDAVSLAPTEPDTNREELPPLYAPEWLNLTEDARNQVFRDQKRVALQYAVDCGVKFYDFAYVDGVVPIVPDNWEPTYNFGLDDTELESEALSAFPSDMSLGELEAPVPSRTTSLVEGLATNLDLGRDDGVNDTIPALPSHSQGSEGNSDEEVEAVISRIESHHSEPTPSASQIIETTHSPSPPYLTPMSSVVVNDGSSKEMGKESAKSEEVKDSQPLGRTNSKPFMITTSMPISPSSSEAQVAGPSRPARTPLSPAAASKKRKRDDENTEEKPDSSTLRPPVQKTTSRNLRSSAAQPLKRTGSATKSPAADLSERPLKRLRSRG